MTGGYDDAVAWLTKNAPDWLMRSADVSGRGVEVELILLTEHGRRWGIRASAQGATHLDAVRAALAPIAPSEPIHFDQQTIGSATPDPPAPSEPCAGCPDCDEHPERAPAPSEPGLREALLRAKSDLLAYGVHLDRKGCRDPLLRPGEPCLCGLDDAHAAIRASLGYEPLTERERRSLARLRGGKDR